MKEEKQEINPYEYGYTQEQESLVNSIGILALIDLLTEVIETQPKVFASLVYADKTEEVRDDNGKLIMVNSEWKEHTPDSFFLSAAQANGGQPGMTALAMKCEQMKYALQSVHMKNIENGVAKKTTDLEKEDALSKLS